MAKDTKEKEKANETSNVLEDIFGAPSAVDSSVSSLFSQPSAVDQNALLVRKRAIINPKRKIKKDTADKNNTESKQSESADVEEDNEEKSEPALKKQKRGSKEDEDEDLETRYLAKLNGKEKDSSEKSEDKKKGKKAIKRVDPNAVKESAFEQSERTVFVGNLPVIVAIEREEKEEFKEYMAKIGPVESIRFRSIAFKLPMPRRDAFLSKAFDETRSALNAYVVYENKNDSKKAKELNGKVFKDHHLRVDHVAHPSPQDNKKSIFIGNLDFEEEEESLWKYFTEKVGQDKVENVRIIRDTKTNFGKGFAMVQFKDFLEVDKCLMLNGEELSTSVKPKKRTMRISRCRNIPKPADKWFGGKEHTNLSEKDKTIMGRAKKVLSKKDRALVGSLVIEGQRAEKGVKVRGMSGKGKATGVKKPRSKEGRAARRSEEHKKKLEQELKEKTK
ncbi:Large 60S ribosomal subunit biogenesis [Komagataella phaffii CBS 7435]|uniref:Nucleolar protein 12 n=2 Tax=Komagataella phaffii TaxID=460519 RepID=C4QYM3_KOMPG|nr:Nucleolar protein, required for pre-25S rRNA processing [Komagataella phaffii GS115]AOA60431.1 GQ67_01657T0 [Komagataella phaffii]CAH2447171.1 Large 60S ribosomal subunit biogenesis [Komagataella phaffii CBS 7435]AOA66407.1 GQ68_01673T0 [Komagataella phaffii GS115]CAY68347.1 Nucleolar protein, required for pre-25S rRNA processing [Komagataella phaffii GS115]CCA37415.1 Large 60S ribosomal subunit biogenesis [Komagataella phaffii CBS 7435]